MQPVKTHTFRLKPGQDLKKAIQQIIILSTDEYIFKREKDGTTPWEEL